MRPASLPNAVNTPALLLAVVAALGPAWTRVQAREPADEAAALAFVGENHPELAELLARLKSMKPEEYRKAVTELSQAAEKLGQLKGRDPRRYDAALEVWKARSRVNLLAARLAGGSGPGTDPESSTPLRAAVEAQVDAEIRQQRTEKAIVEERLTRLGDNLRRLESRRDAAVEARVKNLVNRARRGQTGDVVGADAKAKTKAKAKAAGTNETDAPAPKPEPQPNPKTGERQP